jgi:hypothetical protein
MHTPSRLIPLLLAAMAAVGCREELGPESMPVASASGQVTRAGTPLRGGWVEFAPVEGTVGTLASARIGPDGSYKAQRVPVGTLGVRVVGARPESGEARFLSQGHLIRRRVPPEGADNLDIDLAVEAVRLRASLQAAP